MKKMKKLMSILIVLEMLTTQLVIPQMVSAAANLVEEEVYFEDFDSVTPDERAAWHESFDAGTATPGQWYLYASDVYTHNLALGKTGFPSSEARVPIPFGELDIKNNKYEVTFKLEHVAGQDTIWIASPTLTTNDGYNSLDSDTIGSMGTDVWNMKIVFENRGWTIYRMNKNSGNYESLGGRYDKVDVVDGIVLRIWAGNENIHAVDDICVKQLDKSTGDVLDTVYNETFDDWTFEGNGKSVMTNVRETDCYKRYTMLPESRLIPRTYGNEDGLIGYIKKPSHTQDGVSNYMRFVFPEVMESGKYKISFDWSTAQKACDYIYLNGVDNTYIEIANGSSMYAAQGFRNMELILDMDEGTWQLNGGTVQNFPDGVFEEGINRIGFRHHLGADTATTTMIDNFKITKFVEKTIVITDKDIVITNADGFVQLNNKKVDSNLGNITVNFGKELDETTVTKENIVFSGGSNPEYNLKYENKQIIISLVAGKLELGTDYTLSINNVVGEGEIPVESKEFSFKTNEAEFVKTQIYSEDFNNISGETLTEWNKGYNKDTAVKGQWYPLNTTATLVDHTSVDDKALSTSAHVSGTQDYLYFKLPGDITADGISRYEISFDYYANGSWCDWFYLKNDTDISSYINMDFTTGWKTVKMTIDLANKTWTINDAKCNHENIPSTLDKSDLTFFIRLHGNATAGATVMVDNFNVCRLSEKHKLSTDTFTIIEKKFTYKDGITTADVKLAVNKPGVYNFTAFIAAYKSDGTTLQNVVAVPVSTNLSDTVKTIEGLSIASDNNTDYCKVFIWDMADGNLVPLTEAISSED